MIAKGTPHRDGAILARYLITGKDRERAELWELRGFPCTGIVPAFRSVHIMAAATKCMAPFFHVSVRNPDGDNLDRSQWEVVANVVERMLGLTDQPRAIAVHIAEDTGQSHVHVAWSRIDHETLTAKPLPFFKQRLKQVCRELEERFGLTPVPNERQSSIRFAPTRAEDEQARRLGVDVHATRESIKRCFERSDCGRSFRDALAQEGLVLARGDRRDFLVVDRAGGIHAVGKRIVGMSVAGIRGRFADLSPKALPTLEELRASSNATDQTTPSHSVVSEQEPTRQPDHKRRGRPRATYGKHGAGEKEQKVLTVALRQRIGVAEWEPSKVPDATPRATVDESTAETSPTVSDRDPSVDVLRTLGSQPTEPKLSGNKRAGLVSQIKSQFRALAKQLTAKVPALIPRRRRREETSGGFRAAANWLVRHAARVPPLHFLDPSWEPFTWLRLWEYNDPASVTSQQEYDPSLSRHSLHL